MSVFLKDFWAALLGGHVYQSKSELENELLRG